MILVDKGRLGLTRRVCDYLPEFSGDGREQVYVHHLLTHTSGLERVEMCDWAARPRELPANCRGSGAAGQIRCCSSRANASSSVAPGTEMFYDTSNYDLLGEIVTRPSDRPLGEVVHERIFEPLGMADSFVPLPDPLADRMVRASPESPNRVGVGVPEDSARHGRGFGFSRPPATWRRSRRCSSTADRARVAGSSRRPRSP